MRNIIPWLLVGALGLVTLQGQCAQRALDQANAELDSLQTTVLEERAAAQGWRTLLVESTTNLAGLLQESESRGALLAEDKADLAREVQTLGGRLQIMADLYADAQGQIVAHAEVHNESEESPPDSITAPLDDGLLTGRIAYFPTPQEFDLAYSVYLSLAVAVSEAPDGRGLVTLRASDPRVALSYGEVLYQQPEPVQVCSFGQQAKAATYGALGSELVQLLFSSLKE